MSINKLEIRIVALKRTGHHAMIEWILDGINGRRVFINNSRPGKPVFNPEWIMKRPDYRLITREFDDYDLAKDASGDFQQKDAIIYNYEDWPVPVAFPPSLEVEREKLVGTSDTCIDIIVCRDPLNNAASYYKKFADRLSASDFCDWMKLWSDYAAIALSEKTSGGMPVIALHYSLWLNDPNYRENLAARLGIRNSAMPATTAKWGKGSSFAQNEPGKSETNKGDIDQRALKRRWMEFRADPVFRQMFSNAHVIETARTYLEEIGDNDGLEDFNAFATSLSC